MRFLIARRSEAFKEVNFLENGIQTCGLIAMKEAIELLMNNQVDQYLEELASQVCSPNHRRNSYHSY